MSEVQKVSETYESSGVKWVTAQEVEALRAGAKASRNPVRNELIILMLYRHGLRESELCNLQLEAINLGEARIFGIANLMYSAIVCQHHEEKDNAQLPKMQQPGYG